MHNSELIKIIGSEQSQEVMHICITTNRLNDTEVADIQKSVASSVEKRVCGSLS